MINKKSISLFIFFLFSPVLVFSYHVLITSNPNVFIKWDDTPVNFRVDGGTLGGENGMSLVQDACDEWNDIEDVIDICGNLTDFGDDIDIKIFLV